MSIRKSYLKKIILIMENSNCLKEIDQIYDNMPYNGPVCIRNYNTNIFNEYYVGGLHKRLLIKVDEEEYNLWKQVEDTYLKKMRYE